MLDIDYKHIINRNKIVNPISYIDDNLAHNVVVVLYWLSHFTFREELREAPENASFGTLGRFGRGFSAELE